MIEDQPATIAFDSASIGDVAPDRKLDGMTSTNRTDPLASGFAAGTLVHTDKGPVPIENIQVGDLVLSLLEPTGELAFKRVLNTITYTDKQAILVSYIAWDKAPSHHL